MRIEKPLFPTAQINHGNMFREYLGHIRYSARIISQLPVSLRGLKRERTPRIEQTDSKTIFFVTAHQDDAEQFAGGTAALLRDKGHRVIFIVMSDGAGGSDGLKRNRIRRIRRDEAKRSTEILGVDYINLGLPDYEVGMHKESAIRRFAGLIQEFDPDAIITHSPQDDAHPDHLSTQEIVNYVAPLGARVKGFSRRRLPLTTKKIALYYTDPEEAFQSQASYDLKPFTAYLEGNLFVDVTSVFDRKKDAFSANVSQIGDNGDGETIHIPRIVDTAIRRGTRLRELNRNEQTIFAESLRQKQVGLDAYLSDEDILASLLPDQSFLLPDSQ